MSHWTTHTPGAACLLPLCCPKLAGPHSLVGAPDLGWEAMCAHRAEASGSPTHAVWLGAACRWVVCVCAHVCACVCVCVGGTCACTHAWVHTHAWVWGAHMYRYTCVCVHAHMCVCGRAWLWWEGENDLKHTPKTPPLTIWHVRAGPEIRTDGAKIRRLHVGWTGHGGAVLSTQGAALLAGAEPHWGHRLAGLQRKTFSTSGKPRN